MSRLARFIHFYTNNVLPNPSPSGVATRVTGVSPLSLVNAVAHSIVSLTQYGKCELRGEGTQGPENPWGIWCNNGRLVARRASGLPVRFQPVEWLMATQPTDMGIKSKDTWDIYAKTYRNGTVAQYIYQSDSGENLSTNTTAYTSAGGANWRFGNKTTNIRFPTNELVETRQNRDGVWLNGEQIGTYSGVQPFESVNNFQVAGATSGGAAPVLQIYRVYSIDRNDDTLALDAVAVFDLVDEVYGWYDKVGGEFHTNPNATYTAGPDVTDPVGVYVEGTPETLTVSGGQMLDPATVPNENRYILSGTGAVNTTTPSTGTFRHSEYIPVEGGAAYKLGIVYFTASAAGMAWYSDADVDDYISGVSGTAIRNADGIVTAPATAKYVRFSWHIEEGYDTDWEHSVYLCRIIDDTPALSEWEPYHTPQTASVVNLFAVGDYADEQEIIHGPVTRRVAACYYDGTQTIGDVFLSTTGGKDNGAIIVYPLAEAVTEQAEPQHLSTTEGDNTASVIAEVSGIQLDIVYLAAPESP